MNPHRLGWGFAYSLPFAMIAVALLVVGMMTHPKQVRWPSSGPVTVLALFVVWMGLTTVAAIHFDESSAIYVNVSKVLGGAPHRLRGPDPRRDPRLHRRHRLVGGVLRHQGASSPLVVGGAFRVWGPPGSAIADNNELAVALIVSIPLLYYLYMRAEDLVKLPTLTRLSPKWIRRGLLLSTGCAPFQSSAAIPVAPSSAMSSMAIVLWWRSKSKLTIGIWCAADPGAGAGDVHARRVGRADGHDQDL